MRRLAQLLLLALMLGAGLAPALAVQPDEMLSNPAQEARARHLSAQLRCLVCQNESIDDSEAPLAKDLRLLVRRRIVAGESDRQIMDFLVSRYGEFVLLKPRFGWNTLLLWTLPFIALLAGLGGILLRLRRRPPAAAAPLTAEEEQALSRALAPGSAEH